VTFVPPRDYDGLRVSLRTPGRGVVIEGPSGIGKTTAVRSALTALSQSGDLPYSSPLELSARKPADLEVIEALPQMGDVGMVVVDDFHRLSERSRQRLSDFLKSLADAEDIRSKLILVGINRAGDSLVRLAPDLNNRIDIFRFEANPPELVSRVFQQGADALNIEFQHLDDLVRASYGSFYLAQMLAHQTCLSSGITEVCRERVVLDRPVADTTGRILDDLDRNFYSPTRDFCRGRRPRPRGNAPYMRLLYWLSQEDDWTLSVQNKLNQEALWGVKTAIRLRFVRSGGGVRRGSVSSRRARRIEERALRPEAAAPTCNVAACCCSTRHTRAADVGDDPHSAG
jgi:hypothetical protein